MVTAPMVRLGQRVVLMLGLVVALVSWLSLALAPSVWFLLFARFLQGIASSIVRISSTPYVAELAHSTFRGRLLASNDLCCHTGFLLIYAVGCSSLTWRQVGLLFGLVTTIPPFIGLCCLPDSPRWLATRGRTDEAHKSLVFFRGPDYDSDRELTRILEQLETVSERQMNVTDQLREMSQPSILPYVIIMSVANFLLQLNGFIVIPVYLVIILNDAKLNMSSYVYAVVVETVSFCGILFFTLVMDRINRRPLFTTSNLIAALSTALLGMYFYDKTHERYLQGQEWLPIVCLSMFDATAQNPVLSLLRNELFPSELRSTVVPLLFMMWYTGGFVVLETFPYIVQAIGDYWAFWLFTVCNLILTIIIVSTIPETRGKTLEQITNLQRGLSSL